MVKMQIRYENEIEKLKILEALSKGVKINKISKPSKTGRYYRVYVDIE
jgi:putative lipoic acid-binding regulatory protein